MMETPTNSRDPLDDAFEHELNDGDDFHNGWDEEADPEGEFLDGTFGTPSGDIDVEMGRPAAGGGPTPDAGFAGSSAVNSAMGTMGMAAAQGAFESTKGTFATYATTDRLQPFFNVPAQTVVTRLASSLHPLKAASIVGEETPDLYGPLMVVLTMAAILLNELKQDASVVAQDGTLIGTALGCCVTYWMVSSVFFYFLGYIFDCGMTVPQSLSITGYALFGFTLMLGSQQLVYFPMVEKVLWVIIVGLSCASLGMTFYTRSSVKSQGLVAAGIVMGTQFLFLSYVTLRMMHNHEM